MDLIALIASVITMGCVGVVIFLLKMSGSSEKQVEAHLDDVTKRLTSSLNESFGESITTLSKVAGDKMGMVRDAANQDLDTKKNLIDLQISNVSETIKKVEETLINYEKNSKARLSNLSMEISTVSERAKELGSRTETLNKVLGNSSSRGQWGEKMAEDVLRLAGFIEGINYEQQKGETSVVAESNIRPDYTFNMPGGLKLNMDVKFPLGNYVKYLDATEESDQRKLQKDFLDDVKGHVKDVSTREYIDPAGGTVDYVLLFIPNEGVYEYIYKNGEEIIDGALEKKILIVSPLTLFAILSVIRQSIDNFAISRASGEILQLLGVFEKQWEKFREYMDKTDKQLQTFTKSFDVLKSTRANQLEKSLDRMNQLRATNANGSFQLETENNQ
ncbi:MAG TPA: DNA recombination protein RmuC [Verrucomicrobiales bacterium]|nr:DNA recombination protein RmuC [Verrucomicrobiales bacterium]